MIRSRVRPPHAFRTGPITIVAVVLGMLASSGAALAATGAAATKTVSYRGLRLRVPAGWPVFHLSARSSVCVRFNRHAVYLGRPGSDQSCPGSAIGRTEAILVAPASYTGRLTPVSRLRADPAGGSMLRTTANHGRLTITATWGSHPGVIRTALELSSLRAAMLATNGHRPPSARIADVKARALPRTTSAATPATPGQVYAGLGFDVCTTPSETSMTAWGASSPYAAIGIYIGGANAACLGGNLDAAWVSAESAAGWHMLPLYVGLQAPGNACGCQALSTALTNGQYVTAAAQGTAAAQDAVAQAQALGIGTGNPIYYDMENYKRSATTSAAVLAFLQAWTEQLHASGYQSGIYSSGSSGVTDLVDNYGTSYVEPDELWAADWDASAPVTPPASTANPYVPAADWPGNHQLLQYWSDAAKESYGGVKIAVDRDYVDAPTAAAGNGTFVSLALPTPSLTIKPQPDGAVKLTPQWSGAIGVTGYTIVGGSSPTALAPVLTVTATTKFPVTLDAVYHYYEVQALNSLGQVIGTSPLVTAPASVAIFGNSAYVGARGPVGVPAACLNQSPCDVQAAIYDGKRRLAHSGVQALHRQGGEVLIPLSTQVRRLVATAAGHRLPVSVTLTGSTGSRATRTLQLVPYTVAGRTPAQKSWASPALQVLAQTSFVSNGWIGGVLAVCRTSTPCVATTRVTRGGVALAAPHAQTLGAGELGYLTYRLNAKGHALLRARAGNQLGARVTITTSSPSDTGAVAAVTGTKPATALVSLDSFR